MNTITNLNTFPIGNSLDGVNIITEEINTLSLLVDGTNGMLADLNMNNHSIKNMEAGVDSLDAVNKSQLDLKADTTYVNTQLSTKADTTYVNTQLNLKADTSYVNNQLLLKADTTYVNTQLGLKADTTYVDTQLDLKANTSYVNTQLDLKANTSYVDSSLNLLRTYVNTQSTNTNYLLRNGTLSMTGNLNMNSANKIINVVNPSNPQDVSTKNYVDTQSTNTNYLLRNGNLTMTGNLNMDTINRVRNVADPVFNQDVATKNYVDTQSTNTNYLLRNGTLPMASNLNMSNNYITNVLNPANPQDVATKNYTDAIDTSIRNDVNTSLNLKVNKSGDIMTGALNINYTMTGTTSDRQLSVRTNNDTHNGIFFHSNLSPGWNNLVETNDKAIIFSNGSVGTGKLVIGSWGDYGMKLDGVNGRMTLNSNQIINKNAYTPNEAYVTSLGYLTISSGLFDYLYFTSTGVVTLVLPAVNTIDETIRNKIAYISFANASSINIIPNITGTIVVNNTSTSSVTFNSSSGTKLRIIGNSTTGNYTIDFYNWVIPSNADQLTLQSNLGTDNNSEFTGIKFAGSGTDLGFIRVDTNRTKSDANMTFYLRRANTITTPLTINNNITANIPIIRNAWSSGELIQTKIFNQTTSGSGIVVITSGNATDWKTINFTTKNNNLSDIVLSIKIDFPYFITGSDTDALIVKVLDITGTSQTIFFKTQYYNGSGGGGTRSGTISPIICSYTPTQSLSSLTRTLKVEIKNDSNDDLYVCMGMVKAGSVFAPVNLDNYTIEITEIKK